MLTVGEMQELQREIESLKRQLSEADGALKQLKKKGSESVLDIKRKIAELKAKKQKLMEKCDELVKQFWAVRSGKDEE